MRERHREAMDKTSTPRSARYRPPSACGGMFGALAVCRDIQRWPLQWHKCEVCKLAHNAFWYMQKIHDGMMHAGQAPAS